MPSTPALSWRAQLDVDWIVVGSGLRGLRFGAEAGREGLFGRGAGMRQPLSRRGLRRVHPARTAPLLLGANGLRGVLRMSFFKDVFVVSGSGVGGGSLGYANTLYRARPASSRTRSGRTWATGRRSSRPTTTRPSGCSASSSTTASGPADKLLKEYAEEIGVGETFTNTKVGVFFDKPGDEVPDPFFGGEGPDRTGCMRCGSCMVGCRHGAKNTLMKNYLWFAEKLGVKIEPERQVTEIRPLGAADGSDGYAMTSERSGSWLRKHRRTLRPRAAWSSPPARSAPTTCSPTAGTAARCRASRTGSAT